MFFLPSFGSRYLKWVVGGIGQAYPVEARVCITVLMQPNLLVAAEGEIGVFEIFRLCFKKLKGASVCYDYAVNAGNREYHGPAVPRAFHEKPV